MLLVTGTRDNGRKVIVADTDDMVLEAISVQDYIKYLLSGGKIANLDNNSLQLLLNNRDNLGSINVVILVDCNEVLFEGKRREICLYHSMREISKCGITATSGVNKFFYKHGNTTAVCKICVEDIMYDMKLSTSDNTLNIECNGNYKMKCERCDRNHALALETFSGSNGMVRLKLECGVEISATRAECYISVNNQRVFINGTKLR